MSSDLATMQDQVARLVALVRSRYIPDSPTHDHSHLSRVALLAARICAAEGGNQLVTRSAAWLHDLHRAVRPKSRFFVAPESMDERARQFLDEAGIPSSAHAAIIDAIHYTDRFSFSDRPIGQTASIEARAVRDADNLDAIGAIGIARAFTFGGAFNIPIWVEDAPMSVDLYSQSRPPASTIHHFYEKLLRVPSELETETAIRIARRRSAYLEGFVDQFQQEWDEDSQSTGPLQ